MVKLNHLDSLAIKQLQDIKANYPHVKFSGVQDNPLLTLSTPFPILIVPSVYGEGMPRAIAEAFSLSIPVICTRNSTCGIFDSCMTYVVDNPSNESILSAYNQLLSHYLHGLLPSRLSKCKDFALNQLSSDVIINKTLSIYSDLLSSNPSSYILNKDNASHKYWLPR